MHIRDAITKQPSAYMTSALVLEVSGTEVKRTPLHSWHMFAESTESTLALDSDDMHFCTGDKTIVSVFD